MCLCGRGPKRLTAEALPVPPAWEGSHLIARGFFCCCCLDETQKWCRHLSVSHLTTVHKDLQETWSNLRRFCVCFFCVCVWDNTKRLSGCGEKRSSDCGRASKDDGPLCRLREAYTGQVPAQCAGQSVAHQVCAVLWVQMQSDREMLFSRRETLLQKWLL